jgi:hypothetical protein
MPVFLFFHIAAFFSGFCWFMQELLILAIQDNCSIIFNYETTCYEKNLALAFFDD